ncbi:hypothetical protein DXM26_18430 [Agrobacterium tumefaciens]|uniref:hypothetical protein n=1 Tax=Agrobacterium tumefaciens TaxID=358 RepID=UPI00122FD1A8|nr:hypothetical protein DXM26_18430 [Agrobacterium tumefaciens]
MHTVADRPKLTQVQIIQSLAVALSWFEKEINWGISPGFDGISSLKTQFHHLHLNLWGYINPFNINYSEA